MCYSICGVYLAGNGQFGELALLYDTPRAASVVCLEPGVLWVLDRVTFREILMMGSS